MDKLRERGIHPDPTAHRRAEDDDDAEAQQLAEGTDSDTAERR
jgi:hypothetical protein